MPDNKIPEIVISRLPGYLQILNQMARKGKRIVSSQELAKLSNSSAFQIRKDLNYFGGFGKKGSGYQIFFLIDSLQKILKIDRVWQVALVGVGDLGQALINYMGFARNGIEIVLAFDENPEKIGKKIGPLEIKDIKSLETEICHHKVKLIILAVPESIAQNLVDKMISCGIKAILCYTPANLLVADDIRIQYIDPVKEIQKMTYYI